MRLTKSLKADIEQHARACYPNECCGVIAQNIANGEISYIRLDNVAHDKKSHFEIDPIAYIELEQSFSIKAIVHSHPDGEPLPSDVDKAQMGLHGIDWVICGFGDDYCDIRRHKPKSYISPLLGRDYHHGVQDCYSLVRDYYKRELDITLPDFARTDDWWEDENHEPLYENNFKKAGFVKVDDLQQHDVILCRVGRTHHVNHALVYLGDGKLKSEKTTPVVGDSLVIHHPHGRLSVREIYGENWQKRTALIVRHKDLA